MLRIGIPRAFYYYRFFNVWPRFFFNLGAETVISPPTNKVILNDGINLAVDEMCLPFKVYLGHIEALKKESDYVFVPRLVSIENRCYTCPKVLGLPDVAKLTFPDVKLFTPNINQYSTRLPYELISETAKLFKTREKTVTRAWQEATKTSAKQEFSVELLPADFLGQTSVKNPAKSKGKIALLGHSYNIYDNYITMSLIDKLRSLNFEVFTSEVIPEDELLEEANSLPKHMFWSLGKELIGAAKWLLKNKHVEGIIYLNCFGCGADALIGELVMRYAARQGDIPFLMLSIDEHSGEAGMVTRVEAFTDMLSRRKIHSENHFSPYGKPEHSCQSII